MRNAFFKGFSSTAVTVIIAVVAIVGALTFFLMRSTTSSGITSGMPLSDAPAEETVPTQALNDTQTTIPDIIGRGEDLECEWKLPANAEETPFNKGKLWTSGNQGRSTIDTDINGIKVQANAIYKDSTAYSWMEVNGTKLGFKYPQRSLDEYNDKMTPQERQQAEQIRQEMIVTCDPWTVDETKFALPEDVSFREM